MKNLASMTVLVRFNDSGLLFGATMYMPLIMCDGREQQHNRVGAASEFRHHYPRRFGNQNDANISRAAVFWSLSPVVYHSANGADLKRAPCQALKLDSNFAALSVGGYRSRNQSWTWIGSIHGLDWIGLGRITVTPLFLVYYHFGINKLIVNYV